MNVHVQRVSEENQYLRQLLRVNVQDWDILTKKMASIEIEEDMEIDEM